MSDDDPAARQLLAESEASHPPRPFKTSAERSASLLNAARADRRSTIAAPTAHSPITHTSPTRIFSSPGGVPQSRGRAGKLKRPTYAKSDPTRIAVKDASRRRGEIYDLPASPEKSTPGNAPTETTPKSTTATKQNKIKQNLASSLDSPLPPPPVVQNGSPQAAKHDARQASPLQSGRRRSGRLAGEELDMSQVDWEKRPEQQAETEALMKRKAETALTEAERPKKLPRRTASKTNQGQQKGHSKERRTQSRAKQTHPDSSTAPTEEQSTKNDPVPQVRKSGRKSRAKNSRTASSDAPKATSHPSRSTRAPTVQEINDSLDQHAGEQRNGGDEADEADKDEYKEITESIISSRFTDLDRVFAYLDSGDREGSCRTEDGKKIKIACEHAWSNLTAVDLTPEEVGEHAAIICRYISEVRLFEEADVQKEFKKDAFGYLFFSIAKFLETTYDWFRARYGDPMDSLPALRVLVPLMRATLQFKDTVMTLEGQVPQRFKGDKIVKGVEQNFIAPLRKVEEAHRRSLDRLQRAEEENRIRQEVQARHKKEAEEVKRKEEAESRRKEWELVWQHLHAIRLGCEPSLDPVRRKRLFRPGKRTEEECDANGIKFERVPGFHERKEPYKPKVLPIDLDDWTDEQMETLVNGLQKFAGECCL